VAIYLAWYLCAVVPYQLPAVTGQFTSGILNAPSDLVDSQHIDGFLVSVVPARTSLLGRFIPGTAREHWRVVLQYRTSAGSVKTYLHDFGIACDTETGSYFPLSEVHSLVLRRIGSLGQDIPLQVIQVHLPQLRIGVPVPRSHWPKSEVPQPNLQTVRSAPPVHKGGAFLFRCVVK
jgi:hypothetical protein